MKAKYYLYLILLLSILGLADSWYLTLEHYGKIILPCSTGIFVDCGRVLRSRYSLVFGIPLSLIGVFHYLIFSLVNLYNLFKGQRLSKLIAVFISLIGAISSIYFMYLQLFKINSICLYCTISALISLTLVLLVFEYFEMERKLLFIYATGFIYRRILKPALFLIDAEFVHESVLGIGNSVEKSRLIKNIIRYLIAMKSKFLDQKILGIEFISPVGLAAGFDYKASLPEFLPILGFGFQTIGTITNLPYLGNPKPRLGRLPKSKSLLVNKGFKNEGAERIIKKLKSQNFEIPVGISIGRTNNSKLKTQKDSIKDIVSAFEKFEKANIKNLYYELNISCPNLIHQGSVVFDEPKELDELLSSVDALKMKKPVFIKMPIDKSDKKIIKLLKIIAKHSPKGIIFGNLQKDKNHPSLYHEEVEKFKMGYFSGKPTFERSNELIKLAYREFKDRLVIIGCGGVFSAEDAYTKIKLGASLIQLITGVVYNGPQLVYEINIGLEGLLKKEGYKNISQVIGIDVK